MEDSKYLTEQYWMESDDYNAPLPGFSSKRLLEGIDIKDLCDGKEVIIKLAQDTEDGDLKEDEESFDDIIHCDSKSLREKRGAPPLNCKFKELASKMTNLTEDGLVKKQVVISGVGKVVPDKAYVTIHYNLYKENSEIPFDSTYLRNRTEKFRLGQGETILGLDYAIKSMKKNENSRFFIKWEVAYGALGCPDRIEPKCDIVADVTLVNFIEVENEPDLSSLSQEELDELDFKKLLSQSKQLICHASDEFSKGNIRSAITTYRKVLGLLNSMRLANESQEKLFLEKKLKTLVNLAVCYNKLGKYEQACVACQEALSIDRNSVKANFHYGRAQLALSNFKMAHEYLGRANRLKPNDADINKELKKLNDKKALQEMTDKLFWKRVFVSDEKEKESKNQTEVPGALETFGQKLKESLEEYLKEKKSYILPGPLLEDEKQICFRLANAMNINFEKKEDFFVFSRKKENTS